MELENRTIVITGVGREGQTGEVVARVLAERGARLALASRTAGEAEGHAAALRAAGHEARAFVCDLADAGQSERLAAEVAERMGEVDALVALAGGFAASGPVDAIDPEAWQRQLSINLTTAFLSTRAFLPALRRRRGSIVYMASAAVLPDGKPAGLAAYAAAKSGVLALMRAVAEDERGAGVRANAIAPTSIRTAANVADMGEGARYVEREEVAALVAYLCSPAARSLTGQVVKLG